MHIMACWAHGVLCMVCVCREYVALCGWSLVFCGEGTQVQVVLEGTVRVSVCREYVALCGVVTGVLWGGGHSSVGGAREHGESGGCGGSGGEVVGR